MSRITTRESLFKLVYEMCVIGEFNAITYESITSQLETEDRDFFDSEMFGIKAHIQKLTDIIHQFTASFHVDRIYKIDKAILLVACYEILYSNDVPYQVAVNEAIELAKNYSTERSASFINGVLASVIKHKEELVV